MNRAFQRVIVVAQALIIPVLLVAAWHFAVVLTGTRLIPKPSEVALTLWDLCFGGIYDDTYSGTILIHLGASLSRVYLGFAIAIAVAIPMGLLLGSNPTLRKLLDPTLQALRPVPVTAWLPLSMIFFGLGPRAAIFLIALGAFYPILLNTTLGVRNVEPRLIEAAAMLGCQGSSLFRRVILPGSLPSIFAGLRIGHGFAWIVLVVGEMTGVPEGLGAMIMDGRSLARTDLVIAGMIIIGIAGFLSDLLIVKIGRHFLSWSPAHG